MIDGTSGTANNGKVSVTYTNSTGVLKVLTTGGNAITLTLGKGKRIG